MDGYGINVLFHLGLVLIGPTHSRRQSIKKEKHTSFWPYSVSQLKLIKFGSQGRLQANFKGNICTISPGRNRCNCQILAHLLTIDLLYATGCWSYWFCYYMLRLDSSDMLPGIQKGEETTRSLKTQPLWLSQLVTRCCHMCPCENGETQQVTYPVLGWSFKYEDRQRNSGLDHFALILPNNPQYQLGRSVSFGSYRRTTNQPVFFAKSHV